MAATHPREQGPAVIVTTPEQLRELVRDAVREALSVSREHDRDREPGEWLDTEAAAALLRVHPRTVAKCVTREGLPARKIGRMYRFKRAEVLLWLEQRATGRRRRA